MSTLLQQIAACRAAVLAAAPAISEEQAQTSLALVTLRVQNQGLGVPYSTNQVPVYFFRDKVLNAGGRAYIEQRQKAKGKGRGLGTWGGLRAAEGLPTSSVNLTYTGRMFRSLTVVYAGVSGTVYSSRIVSADSSSAQVVAFNQQRYGPFLEPNAAELAQVQQVGQARLDGIIRQFFSAT